MDFLLAEITDQNTNALQSEIDRIRPLYMSGNADPFETAFYEEIVGGQTVADQSMEEIDVSPDWIKGDPDESEDDLPW